MVTLTGDCNFLTVDYCGTAPGVMDFLFTVFTDCPITGFTFGALDPVPCADGNGRVTFTALPAGTYYLPVLADAGFIIQGDYTMTLLSEDCPPPPSNDDACDAQELQLDTPAPFSSLFATAQPNEVSPGIGSTGDGCNSQDGWCSLDPEAQNSIWFYFTAPPSGNVIVRSEPLDAQLAVYSVGDCNDFSTFTLVGANDDSNPACAFCPLVELTCLIPGQVYYVQLDGFDGEAGAGTITVTDEGLANIITGYTLVNSNTNADVAPLLDGDIINRRFLPNFNVRADVCRPVRSVKFDVNGNQFRIENVFPYALGGDNPTGNYRRLNLAPGQYMVETTPYSGLNAGGNAVGLSDVINFTVVDEYCFILTVEITTDAFAEETSYELVDLTDNTVLGSVAEGELLSNSTYRKSFCVDPSHCYEFRIFDAFGDGICCAWGTGSYTVTYDGEVVASGGAFADEESTVVGANCNPDCAGTPGGSLVTDVNGDCCEASELDCDGVCFGGNLSGIAVTSFTLVNAQSNTDIGPLFDGTTIDLSLTGPISIRANVCNDATVESVKFFSNGTLIKIENIIFYTIAGDNNGNYSPWNVQPGVYTLTATPYSADNGTGTVGTSHTITITIVNSALKWDPNTVASDNGAFLKAFPNPFRDNLTFEFILPDDSQVSLELFSISGAKIATIFEGSVKGGETMQKVFTPGNLADGLYLYRLRTNDAVITDRVMLAR